VLCVGIGIALFFSFFSVFETEDREKGQSTRFSSPLLFSLSFFSFSSVAIPPISLPSLERRACRRNREDVFCGPSLSFPLSHLTALLFVLPFPRRRREENRALPLFFPPFFHASGFAAPLSFFFPVFLPPSPIGMKEGPLSPLPFSLVISCPGPSFFSFSLLGAINPTTVLPFPPLPPLFFLFRRLRFERYFVIFFFLPLPRFFREREEGGPPFFSFLLPSLAYLRKPAFLTFSFFPPLPARSPAQKGKETWFSFFSPLSPRAISRFPFF